jgi:dimethylhistidine N-methyltransferase
VTGQPFAPLAAFRDFEPEISDFESAVIGGLSQPRKSIPCKFFYDQRGSRLFDEICDLDEYYPTRTELAILECRRGEIARLAGPGVQVVEFGSGASTKARLLLAALDRPVAYAAVDISREHLLAATMSLAREFARIEIMAVCADYTRPFSVPRPQRRPDAPRVGFFPGSTIGNFMPDEARSFLSGAAALLAPGGGLLIGVDLKKDRRILHAAYNDAKGVTAAFNLNLLARINRELAGTFDLRRFAHEAVYDAEAGRIEMHLRSRIDQEVKVRGHRFSFRAGETIHTENSYKYSIGEFQTLAESAGFRPVETWTDDRALFSLHYLRVP